jgi:hypothetical protein
MNSPKADTKTKAIHVKLSKSQFDLVAKEAASRFISPTTFARIVILEKLSACNHRSNRDG